MDSGESPFRHWVIDGWCEPCRDVIPAADWPGWEARYENDTERHKRTTRHLIDFPACRTIVNRLCEPGTISEWSARIGYTVEDDPTMHGGGLHVTAPGGWLSTHLDYDRHPYVSGKRRALNLIAFLNHEWRHEWGGALVLCDAMGEAKKRIYPAPGRLVAFEVGDLSYHGVEPVTGPVERITAAVYYLGPAGARNTRKRALFLPNRGKS